MDQGEPDGQTPLGLLRERCKGPSLGGNQFVLVARLVESRPQKPAEHYGSLKSRRSLAPYQEES